MKRYVKVDFSGASGGCLVAVSWPSAPSELSKSVNVLKLETETERHFVSVVSRSSSPAANSVLKINGQFGKLLHLKDGQNVSVTPVEYDIPFIKSAYVCCVSEDDWEILETNTEVVVASLLNQLRVVYSGLHFPFWISKSVPINLRIEKIDPPVEVGILDTFSEIIVPSLLSTSSTKPFNLNFSPQLRIHPLTLLSTVNLTPSTNLLFENIFHAFVYRSNLVKCDDDDDKVNASEQISLFAQIVFDSEDANEQQHDEQKQYSNSIMLKIFFIENIIESDKELVVVFPKLNPPCLFIHPKLAVNFSLKLKSFASIEQVAGSTIDTDSPQYSPIAPLLPTTNESSTCFQAFTGLVSETKRFLSASLGLTEYYHGVYGSTFGLMLVTGKSGSGKTTFAQNIAKDFENFPHFLHWENISCAKLKGKKSETIQKEFDGVIKRAIELNPTILILDDLDILCPAEKLEQPNAQEEFLNYRLCETICEVIMSLEGKQIAVLCTATTTNSLHSYWKSREGLHIFQHHIHLPPPNQVERLGIFVGCLRRYQSRAETITRTLSWRATASTPALSSSKAGFSKEEAEDDDDDDHDVDDENQDNNKNLSVPPTNNTGLSLQHRFMTAAMETALFNLHDDYSSPNTIHNIAKKWMLYQTKKDFTTISEQEKNDAFDNIIQDEIKLKEASSKKHKIAKTITWSHIGGLSNVKKDLTKILQWPIKYSKLFDKSPIKMPSGILLYGFPGTGKTLLGLSMPSVVTNAKFIHIKGPELLSKYIGASEQAVQDLFRKAKESSPCIIFFDEFDSLVPRRGHDSTGVTDRVVNQFLAEMDGIEGGLGKGVYLIAATSRPDLIDPAVLRPGRLDKHLFFPMPNQEERLEIMKALSADVKYSESDGKILWNEIGRETEGFTGADLHSLLCTAQLESIQESLAEMLENSSSSFSSSSTETVITAETMNNDDGGKGKEQETICVTQKHIKKALKTFKPSLQKAEFINFQNIYANFSSTAKGTLDNSAPPSSFLIEQGKRATLA